MFFKPVVALLAASAAVAPSAAGPVRRFSFDELVDNIKDLPGDIKDAGESIFSGFTENAANGISVVASAIKEPEGIPSAVESVFDKATSNVAQNFASVTSSIGSVVSSVTSEIGSDHTSTSTSTTTSATSTSTSSSSNSDNDNDDDSSNGTGKASVPSAMMFTTVAGGILLGSLYVL